VVVGTIRRYELNTCGPAYVAVGDGGNVEGVYRNFVDEVDPSLGKYFCERSYTQRFNNTTPEVPDFLAGYQRAPHPLGCRTVSLERSYIDRNNVPRSTPMGLGEIHPELPDHYWCVRAEQPALPVVSTPVVSARWLTSWLTACGVLSAERQRDRPSCGGGKAMMHTLGACLSP